MLEALQIIIQVTTIAILVSLALAGLSIAPWVPTRKKDFERVHKCSDLKKGETFIEIGCGDARVTVYIARKNPEVEIIGIELSWVMYLISVLQVKLSRVKNVKIIHTNALKYDLSGADVVYFYALHDTFNLKLKPKLLKELKKGSRIVSYAFSLDDWSGKYTKDKPTKKDGVIHTYTV